MSQSCWSCQCRRAIALVVSLLWLAFAGPAGSGKTLCAARLAIAYASGSDLPVVCVTLSPADGGNELRAQTDLNKAIAEYQRATGNSLTANNVEIK